MGCNIHLHIEIKINDNWEHYGCPFIPRDYELYAKMAGVRNEEFEFEPISAPKGLPDDITYLTALDYRRDRYHFASWFNIAEIAELVKWWDDREKGVPYYPDQAHGIFRITGYLFDNSFHRQTVANNVEIQDVRFVFWFDH